MVAGATAALGEHGEGFASPPPGERPDSRRSHEPRGGAAGGRHADVCAEEPRARLGRLAVARRPDARAARAPPRAPRSPVGRRRAGARGGGRARDGRRAARRGLPRRRAPRHRQDGDPRRDPEQARAARPRRVGVHARTHADRRADHRRRPGPRSGRAAGALEPRALGRQRLSRRACAASRSRSAPG